MTEDRNTAPNPARNKAISTTRNTDVSEKTLPNSGKIIRRRLILVLLGWAIAISISGAIAGVASAADIPNEPSRSEATQNEQVFLSAHNIEQILAAGNAAIKRSDYDKALKLWKPLSDRGIPAAQYGVAMIYSRHSVHIGHHNADNIDRPTGAQNSPNAHLNSNQEIRFKLAHELFVQAGSKGHVKSIFQLGYQYERGIGTQRDLQKSLFFYRVAAFSHNIHAQLNLAILFANGHYQKPDAAKAYKWIVIARREALRKPPSEVLNKRINKLFTIIEARTTHQQRQLAEKIAIKLIGLQT